MQVPKITGNSLSVTGKVGKPFTSRHKKQVSFTGEEEFQNNMSVVNRLSRAKTDRHCHDHDHESEPTQKPSETENHLTVPGNRKKSSIPGLKPRNARFSKFTPNELKNIFA